ncbi:hypothetical protein [Capnocytophaga sp. oral taxon 338]|jgi:hypothetical protein|uniref:hypothetical protein n=1 Tax=Capnocytophaga sp. oral taxon 338 TaxID=710239 RepID=UPI000202CC24|nr:hypothetical protein [Capnocytophaga sp. oral taxon 338]EGD33266.1 hypothetical protein HMPREF9071_2060 [Capnocytophaga sp. oral taxon 338 str. F0234]
MELNKEAISKRLNEVYIYLRKHTEYVSQTLLAQKIGESRSNFSAALNGNEKYITEGLIRKLVNTFPEISKDWLLQGKGEMLSPDEELEENYLRDQRKKYGLSLAEISEYTKIPLQNLKAYEYDEKRIPVKVQALLERFFERVEYEYENRNEDIDSQIPVLQTEQITSSVKVPYYDVDFAGGWTSMELFSQVKPSFIISSPDFARAEFACNLVGNSISRRIRSGSIIGLRKIEDWQVYFPTSELYAVVLKNNLRTVKIVKRSKKEGFLELIPDPLPEYNHPPYEMELVPMDYVIEFYQVVAYAFFERLTM